MRGFLGQLQFTSAAGAESSRRECAVDVSFAVESGELREAELSMTRRTGNRKIGGFAHGT